MLKLLKQLFILMKQFNGKVYLGVSDVVVSCVFF